MTARFNIEHFKKEAKRWLRKLQANDAEALARFRKSNPNAPAEPGLRDVQHALARERGFDGWTALKDSLAAGLAAKYDQLAADMVAVYATGDDAAMQRLNQHYGRASTADDLRATVWRLIYRVRRAKGAAEAFGIPEAQELIARTSGFSNWKTLVAGAPPVPPYELDDKENTIRLRRDPSPAEWDAILASMRERRLTALEGEGFLTDDVLRRLGAMDHVTSINLSGSRAVSDDGLLHLAAMPQLERLDLSEYPGGKLTDRGLAVLRQLPNLRFFKMVWQRGISDIGMANLRYCEKLEDVGLMGTPTGDGVIAALSDKSKLWRLQTGRLVTDAGLALLPRGVTSLLIDGPFTNAGLATIGRLQTLAELDLFWHVSGITTDAFAVLGRLPNLETLGCDGALCDDRTMAHIASAPRLRKLRAQGSAATDAGFIALSRSTTLEKFWGREAPGLTGRGFTAMSRMPSLQALGVSLMNVDDASLASLPLFPALRDLTPIDVSDDGFRHVGRCQELERLACMYCRETTDIATEHIAGLHLKSYYAGLTKITDRSLEILGRMRSLEKIEFYETKSVTDAGLLHLAALPNLREVEIFGLPEVTYEGTRVFPGRVRVAYAV